MGRVEKYFEAYIERIRPAFEGMDRETAHAVASALLGFKFGLYDNAVTRPTRRSENGRHRYIRGAA